MKNSTFNQEPEILGYLDQRQARHLKDRKSTALFNRIDRKIRLASKRLDTYRGQLKSLPGGVSNDAITARIAWATAPTINLWK